MHGTNIMTYNPLSLIKQRFVRLCEEEAMTVIHKKYSSVEQKMYLGDKNSSQSLPLHGNAILTGVRDN